MNASSRPRDLILVKLGGSLITDKATPRRARLDVIDRLAGELAAGLDELQGAGVILGHGSGSFGHVAAAEHDLGAGLTSDTQLSGVSATQAAAHELHGLVVRALVRRGALPFSLPPGAWLTSHDGEAEVSTLDPLRRALELGLTPVVCGDVILDSTRGVSIVSTEGVLATLTRALRDEPRFRARRAIWFGNTPGVLDSQGEPLRDLDVETWSVTAVQPSDVPDVTGGIRLRVDTALALARLGVPSLITDGTVPGRLREALRDPNAPGTRVASRIE